MGICSVNSVEIQYAVHREFFILNIILNINVDEVTTLQL